MARECPWREVQRARIVLYAVEGRSDVEIASRLDTSAGIVGRWRRRFQQDRLEGPGITARGLPAPFPHGAVAEVKARLRAAAHPRPPSRRRSAKFARHSLTVGSDTPASAVIWVFVAASAARNTIRARSSCSSCSERSIVGARAVRHRNASSCKYKGLRNVALGVR